MTPAKLLLTIFLGISMLSGCASMSQQSRGQGEEGALAAAEKALPPLPDMELTADILNNVLLAEIALQRGHYGVAVRGYWRLAAETRDPRLAERATRVAVFAREYQVALEVGRLWMELVPGDIEGRQILTALLVKTGDYDAALDSLEQVMAKTSTADFNERYLLLIRLLGREQDKEGALQVVKFYLERHPDDAAGLFAYAQLALRGGKLEEAEKNIDHLLEQKPDWAQAVILRTRILQVSGREAAALDYMRQSVDRRGKDMMLRNAYGRMLVDAGRLEEALEQFQYVLKAQDNEDVMFAAGLVALRLERLEKAEEYFLHLNRGGVRLDETSYYLGRIEEIKGNYDRAIRWYGTVGRGENYLNAQIHSALLQARQGEVDTARAQLNAVQVHSPGQRLRIFLAEGEILRDVGRYDDAMEVYNRALQEVPGNTELLYARAMVAEKMDRLDIVEKDLLAILEREPDHVDALNSLGYTLADKTTRYKEAHNYVQRALELKPDSYYILDSMGWVQYRMGNLKEAVKYLRRAMELNYDPEIAVHLGEVLWAMGDHEAARSTWQRALKESPQSELLLNTIKRLDR